MWWLMAKAVFVRTLGGLQPADDAGREMLQGIQIGSDVMVDISRPRSLPFHKRFYALAGIIAKSIGVPTESVVDIIKLRTGHFKVIQTAKERYQVPRSISFAKMDSVAFADFYKRAEVVICEEFLPHLKPDGLRTEIENMVGVGS